MATKTQLIGGAFQDAEGNLLANGYLKMRLNQDELVNTNNQVCAGVELTIQLDSNGNVASSTSTPPASNQLVWANDIMTPTNSYYKVTGYKQNGQPAWGPNNQQVTSAGVGGGTFDTGTWVPNQVVSWSPALQPVVLQTNEVNNGNQFLLDLHAGANVTLTDNGAGRVTVASAAGISLQHGGVPNSSQTVLNLIAGTNMSLSDGGGGAITINNTYTQPAADVMSEIALATSARAVGTIYQNTTGGPILVIANIQPGSNSSMISFISDANASPTTVLSASENYGSGAVGPVTVMGIVPNNYYYKVIQTGTGTGVPNTWREFSFTKGTVTMSANLAGSTRVLATNYQNTSGSLIFVLANLTSTTYNQGPIEGLSDSTATPTQRVWAVTTPGGVTGGQNQFVWMPVLPGDYYRITRNTDPSAVLSTWFEFTWSGITATRNIFMSGNATVGMNPGRHWSPGVTTGTATVVANATVNAAGKTRWVETVVSTGNNTEIGLRSGEDSAQVMWDCTSQATIQTVAGLVLTSWQYAATFTAGNAANQNWIEWSFS